MATRSLDCGTKSIAFNLTTKQPSTKQPSTKQPWPIGHAIARLRDEVHRVQPNNQTTKQPNNLKPSNLQPSTIQPSTIQP
ncbi:MULTISPECIES: hypothetical protein [unclassified Moorena]|uniref:hypothetical protein n=1 Tax=unclassified Moorena TaxID=2683338 RepID=UPI001400F01F|nr:MULTISPECIES: hypothetical protein [unclassified Moorena]NEO15358.1 hypothetical protein [Moorena sp. SIO3E8]NEQ02564.1 hypothetical protein [Moorena sp. SIO3F7]